MKQLPCNIDAERAVLGSLLINNDSINSILLHPNDFYDAKHHAIFDAMREEYYRKQSFDAISILAHLRSLNGFNDAGYLASLYEAVPTAVNIQHHAEIVSEKAIARRLVLLSHNTMQSIFQETAEIRSILAETEKKLTALVEKETRVDECSNADVMVDSATDFIERRKTFRKNNLFVKSGLYVLDKMTGGFSGEDYIVISGRPGQGKTAIALKLIEHNGYSMPVLMFSLEMSKDLLITRLASSAAGINLTRLARGYGDPDDMARYYGICDRLKKLKMICYDKPCDIEQIKVIARREFKKSQIRFLIIDYFQLIKYTGKANREEGMTFISKELLDLRKELDIPIIALSQLNYEGHTRYTGSLEEDATIQIVLESIEKQPDKLKITVKKNRNGITGTKDVDFIRRYQQLISERPLSERVMTHEEEEGYVKWNNQF